MIREKQNVRLSAVDEERFTIYDMPSDQMDGPLAQMRKTFIWTSIVMVLILVAVAAAGILVKEPWFRLLMVFLGLCDMFMFISNVDYYRKNTFRMRMHSHYIEVEILEKLPLEKVTIDSRMKFKKEEWTFFPVKARDTKKRNYSSLCYLKKEEYNDVKVGDVIKLKVPLSKDYSKKKK